MNLVIESKFNMGDRIYKTPHYPNYCGDKEREVYITGIKIDTENQTFMYYYDDTLSNVPIGNTWFSYEDWEKHFFRDKGHLKEVMIKNQEDFYKNY